MLSDEMKAKVDEVVATVPGTDGAKMSKSYGNTIDMFGTKIIIHCCCLFA